MEKAATFGTKIIRGWIEGEFDLISSDEATAGMVSALPPENQEKIWKEQIYPAYGEFGRLSYKETYMAGGNHIFRFRGAFEKGSPEVRVVISPEGLVTGFWIRPWSETLK